MTEPVETASAKAVSALLTRIIELSASESADESESVKILQEWFDFITLAVKGPKLDELTVRLLYANGVSAPRIFLLYTQSPSDSVNTDSNVDRGDYDSDGGALEINPSVRCSSWNKHPVDRMLSCSSLVKGLLFGFAIHILYTSTKHNDFMFEGRHPYSNQSQNQFYLGNLRASRLCKVQTLSMLQNLADPHPDEHIGKCMMVAIHKVRDLDGNNAHVKVKAVWTNANAHDRGAFTTFDNDKDRGRHEYHTVRGAALTECDMLAIQELLYVKHGVRKKIVKMVGSDWIKHYLVDDQRMASMVKGYNASVIGNKSMFGVDEISRNVKHVLEFDKENRNKLCKALIDNMLQMINQFPWFD